MDISFWQTEIIFHKIRTKLFTNQLHFYFVTRILSYLYFKDYKESKLLSIDICRNDIFIILIMF